jgi:hypothetical protein
MGQPAYVSDTKEWPFGQDGPDNFVDFIKCLNLFVGEKRVVWAGTVFHAGTTEPWNMP